MARRAHALVLLAAMLPLLVTTGCGGGGGGSDLPLVQLLPPEFTGDYHYLALGGTTPPSTIEEVLSEFGTARPDHAGGITLNWRSNVNGSPEPPAVSDLTTYDVQPDGSFRWLVPASGGAPLLEGGLRRDGNVGILAATGGAGIPEVRAVLRRRGTLGEASLNGAYHCATWRYSPDSGDHESREGTYHFDGAGSWNGGGSWRSDSGHGWFVPSGWYTLTGPGDLLVSDRIDTMTGGILDDGSIAILGGTAHPGRPYLAAFVRYQESGGLSDATLSGTYHFVTFSHTVAGYVSTYGTLSSNGSGYWTTTTRGKTDTLVLPNATASGTYSVNEHGKVDLHLSSGDVLEGGVSADGTFACLAAGMTPTIVAPPQIWLLVKR